MNRDLEAVINEAMAQSVEPLEQGRSTVAGVLMAADTWVGLPEGGFKDGGTSCSLWMGVTSG
jgi:hypothetical protein